MQESVKTGLFKKGTSFFQPGYYAMVIHHSVRAGGNIKLLMVTQSTTVDGQDGGCMRFFNWPVIVLLSGLFHFTGFAQVGSDGGFEKYEFQAGAWSMPDYPFGESDIHGNLNFSIELATISSPSGISVPVSIGYSSDIRWADPVGPIGVGWTMILGNVSRSVQGSEVNLGDWTTELGTQPVDFPSIVSNSLYWDGIMDIYSITLPDGRSVRCILDTSSIDHINNYHSFKTLKPSPWKIRGYYNLNDQSQNLSMCAGFMGFDLSNDNGVPVVDYYAFSVTDEFGTKYFFEEGSTELSVGKNGRKSKYISSWWITEVHSPLSGSEMDPAVAAKRSELMIQFQWTGFIHSSPKDGSKLGHDCNNDLNNDFWISRKFCISISSVTEKVELVYKEDKDIDVQTQIAYFPDKDRTSPSIMILDSSCRKKVDKIIKKQIGGAAGYEEQTITLHQTRLSNKSFLDSVSFTRDRTQLLPAYKFTYFNTSQDGSITNFEFDPVEYAWYEQNKYNPFDTRFDINGYMKSRKDKYFYTLNSDFGQLKSMRYPNGRTDSFDYDFHYFQIPDSIEVKSLIYEGNTPQQLGSNIGTLLINTKKYFGTEIDLLETEAQKQLSWLSGVDQGTLSELPMNYFSKSTISKITSADMNKKYPVERSFYFGQPVLVGLPRYLDFDDRQTLTWIKHSTSQVTPLPDIFHRRSSRTGVIDDKIWFAETVITEKGKPSVKTVNRIAIQDLYYLITQNGSNQRNNTLWGSSHYDLSGPLRDEIRSETSVNSVNKLFSGSFVEWSGKYMKSLTGPNWKIGSYYFNGIQQKGTLNFRKQYGESDSTLIGARWTNISTNGMEYGSMSPYSYDNETDSTILQFSLKKPASDVYNDLLAGNRISPEITGQVISGFLKIRGKITENYSPPWNSLELLFEGKKVSGLNTNLTVNSVTTYKRFSGVNQMMNCAVYRSKNPDQTPFTSWDNSPPDPHGWELESEAVQYHSFGGLIEERTPLLTIQYFYGNNQDQFENVLFPDNWYRKTGVELIGDNKSFRMSATYNHLRQMNTSKSLNNDFEYTRDLAGRVTSIKRNGILIEERNYLFSRLFDDNDPVKLNRIQSRTILSPSKSVYHSEYSDGLRSVRKESLSGNEIKINEPVIDIYGKITGQQQPVYLQQYNYSPESFYQGFGLGNLYQTGKLRSGSRKFTEFKEDDILHILFSDFITYPDSALIPYSASFALQDGNGTISYPAGREFFKENKYTLNFSWVEDFKNHSISEDADGNYLYTVSMNEKTVLLSANLSNQTEKTLAVKKIFDPKGETILSAPPSDDGSAEMAAGYSYFTVRPGYGIRIKMPVINKGRSLIIHDRWQGMTDWKKFSSDYSKDTVDVVLPPGFYAIDGLALTGLMMPPADQLPVIYEFRITDKKRLRQVSYQYDAWGRVTDVIHPDGSRTQYRYDTEGRVIAKESPYHHAMIENGSKPEADGLANPDFRYVYDHFGRLRFSIDPNQSVSKKMNYYKYDSFSRLVEMGEMNTTGYLSQANADIPSFPQVPNSSSAVSGSTPLPESDTPASTVAGPSNAFGALVLLKNYYDLDQTLHGFPVTVGKGKLGYQVQYIKTGDNQYQPVRRYYAYKREGWISSCISLIGRNKQEEVYGDYDYTGRVGNRNLKYNGEMVRNQWFTYYNLGGIKDLYQSNTESKPAKPLISYEYNTMAMLKSVTFNGQFSVEYTNDIRGWKTSTIAGELFSELLAYHEIDPWQWKTSTAGWKPSYTGNITKSETMQSAFGPEKELFSKNYFYDELGRLISAKTSSESNSTAGWFDSDYEYDLMGNIRRLNRQTIDAESGLVAWKDQLVYQYGGNRLLNVVDLIASSSQEDYETIQNSIIGTGNAQNLVSEPFVDGFDAYPVKSGARPESPDWDPVGFYGSADPSTSISITTDGPDRVLNLKPTNTNKSASLRSTLKPVTALRQYMLSGKYKGKTWFNGEINKNSAFYAGIEWLRIDGTRISVKWIVSNSHQSNWKYFSGSTQAPAGATHARIILVNMNAPNTEVLVNTVSFSESGLVFAYDNNGNVLKDLNRNISSISYNGLNLPEKITSTDQTTIRYGYAGAGNRMMKITGTDTLWYIRTAAGEMVGEYKNTISNLWSVSIGADMYGTEGQFQKVNGAWKPVFYIKDHLGNIRSRIRMDGTTITQLSATDYYPYGSVAREMTAALDEEIKFRYQGKERDLETGYDYFEARTYDSQLGRFMQVDPMWEKYRSLNSFCAMANSPLIFKDNGGDTVTISITGTKSNSNAYGWYLSGGENVQDNVRVSLPLYNVRISNESGSASDWKVTRDATHESSTGKGAFLGIGKFSANIKTKVTAATLRNIKLQLAIIEIQGTTGRTGIQIHAIGQSTGCFMIENGMSIKFMEAIYKLLDEDGNNGHGEIIVVNIEAFTEDATIRENARIEYERRVAERLQRQREQQQRQQQQQRYFDDLDRQHIHSFGNYNNAYHPGVR